MSDEVSLKKEAHNNDHTKLSSVTYAKHVSFSRVKVRAGPEPITFSGPIPSL